MKKYIIISFVLLEILFGVQVKKIVKKLEPMNSENINRMDRSGDFGLVCQNETGSYNTGMINYVTSPEIQVPLGDAVSVDFLLKGSILDGSNPDTEPIDFWGMQISSNGSPWYYVSNPYGSTDTSASNFIYVDAPNNWSFFSQTYSTPIVIDDYAGTTIRLRYWFESDDDEPQGEGLFLDDISVNVDGEDIYFESFEDSTMAGWVTEDRTAPGPSWHPDTYGAYGGSGKSWWMGDPDIGTNGGYYNHWYQVLDTPPIDLPSSVSTQTIVFDQKRFIENLCSSNCPTCADDPSSSYDGWDALNVRISSDGGENWEVLEDVSPAYNSSNTFSFGYEFEEGCNIPGWGGPESGDPNNWTNTIINIPTSYNGQEVIVRFAFTSDPGYDTELEPSLTGVWVDNINIANGTFTSNGEDEFVNETLFAYTSAEGFVSQSLVTEGNGDLWHVDFIGVPPVLPMPSNVVVNALDGSVEVSWNSPSSAEEYDNDLISYSNENFAGNSIVVTTGQGYLGTLFDMPYGIESAIAHSVRVHASSAGSTTLAGFAVVGGIPAPTPLYTQTVSTVENAYSDEISLNWEFQSSFIIALLVTGEIGLSIDETATPSSNSWSNLGGWEPWSDVASAANLGDGEFGIQAIVTSQGGSAPKFNIYRNPSYSGSPGWQAPSFWINRDVTSVTDYNITNGTEYCYQIASVFNDTLISEKTDPVCGVPISNFVYEIAYDDGSHEDVVPVGDGNLLASKFTPSGYPSNLYSAKFYVAGSQAGEVLTFVWKDNGSNGEPGTMLVPGYPDYFNQGWNEFNFQNNGFDIEINEGGVYIGFQQMSGGLDFKIGIDENNASYSQNSMLNINTITEGWDPLNSLSAGGVWMIRAEFDGENELSNVDEISDIFPEEYILNQNYPNPFNPFTAIKFGLKEQSFATLEIFNILGESVLIVAKERLGAGLYSYKIDMSNFPSGMYFYKLTATNEQGQQLYYDMKKMILLQ